MTQVEKAKQALEEVKKRKLFLPLDLQLFAEGEEGGTGEALVKGNKVEKVKAAEKEKAAQMAALRLLQRLKLLHKTM
jgi:hypothetical protein